ncbi:class I SAM-dependent methyltransferase [Paenibacillus sp. CAU 1782]
MKPWYEQSFGRDYMLVYKHRDWEDAAKEVRKMAQWLHLPQDAAVLDIGCGMGRHSTALADYGFRVTGVDLSETLLDVARQHDSSGKVEWRHGDMRSLPFGDASFDATVNLFTSFGYFTLEEDNINVLKQIRRVLRRGGSFLIDFLNPVYVERTLTPRSERSDEETGIVIIEERSIKDGWVQKEITLNDPQEPGKPRQYLERVRLYQLQWFEKRLSETGLKLETLYGGYDGEPYESQNSPRMILAGKAD